MLLLSAAVKPRTNQNTMIRFGIIKMSVDLICIFLFFLLNIDGLLEVSDLNRETGLPSLYNIVLVVCFFYSVLK